MEKWRKMLPDIDNLIKKRDSKMKDRIRKGIPNGKLSKKINFFNSRDQRDNLA